MGHAAPGPSCDAEFEVVVWLKEVGPRWKSAAAEREATQVVAAKVAATEFRRRGERDGCWEILWQSI